MSKPKTIVEWVEDRQASGRYTFTREEAEASFGGSKGAVRAALRRLKLRRRIAAPRRGFYVIVPVEYRVAGCVPASWFIDDLMGHLGRSYYVGLLSAAALHGAAHQQPMVFQVIADRPVRPMSAGRVRIEAHVSNLAHALPTVDMQTETGSMRVGSAETTAFDLVRFPRAAGQWNNVATVLTELAETLEASRLLEIAPQVRLPDVQRLGYLLTLVGASSTAAPLADWLARRRTSIVRLRTDEPAGGQWVDPKWRLIPNEVVEPDL